MKIFAERLKDLRNEKGLSTKKLGMEIGISNASISRWENNVNDIKAEELAVVARYFKVSADYLIGLED